MSQGDNFKARIKLQSLKNSKYDATFWDVSGWPVMRSIAEVHEGIITATDVTRRSLSRDGTGRVCGSPGP
ncbi:MAG: hypothetical protein R3D26_23140 [Cyanobacteriota/Melainabacteria group bacterium]